MVSSRTAEAALACTRSDIPSARERDAKKLSPPESAATSRTLPLVTRYRIQLGFGSRPGDAVSGETIIFLKGFDSSLSIITVVTVYTTIAKIVVKILQILLKIANLCRGRITASGRKVAFTVTAFPTLCIARTRTTGSRTEELTHDPSVLAGIVGSNDLIPVGAISCRLSNEIYFRSNRKFATASQTIARTRTGSDVHGIAIRSVNISYATYASKK